MPTAPGYDFIVQAMGGIMDLTGTPDGEPQKPGVAYADLFTGLYAVIAIQAALLQRAAHAARGRCIDLALFDTQVAVLANQAMNFLVSGVAPRRMGNAHPNLVPYQVFRVADGELVIAVGSDQQFARLVRSAGRSGAGRRCQARAPMPIACSIAQFVIAPSAGSAVCTGTATALAAALT